MVKFLSRIILLGLIVLSLSGFSIAYGNISLVSPANGAMYTIGDSINLTVNVTTNDSSNVTFVNGYFVNNSYFANMVRTVTSNWTLITGGTSWWDGSDATSDCWAMNANGSSMDTSSSGLETILEENVSVRSDGVYGSQPTYLYFNNFPYAYCDFASNDGVGYDGYIEIWNYTSSAWDTLYSKSVGGCNDAGDLFYGEPQSVAYFPVVADDNVRDHRLTFRYRAVSATFDGNGAHSMDIGQTLCPYEIHLIGKSFQGSPTVLNTTQTSSNGTVSFVTTAVSSFNWFAILETAGLAYLPDFNWAVNVTGVVLNSPANNTQLSAVNTSFSFTTGGLALSTCSLYIDGVSRNSTFIIADGSFSLGASQYLIDNNYDGSYHNWSISCAAGTVNSTVYNFTVRDPAYNYWIDSCPRTLDYAGEYVPSSSPLQCANVPTISGITAGVNGVEIDCRGGSVNFTSTYYGVQVSGVSFVNVTNCTFTYNLGGFYNPMYVFNAMNVSITNNNFSGFNSGSSSNGIRIFGTSDGTVFEDNIVLNNGQYAVNGVGKFLRFDRNTLYGESVADFVDTARNNTVYNYSIYAGGFSFTGSRTGGDYSGNRFLGSAYLQFTGNMATYSPKVYNNLFNISGASGINYFIWATTNNASLKLNTTATSGTNIVGRSQFGGNYYGYTNGTGPSDVCANQNNDSFCDAAVTLQAGMIDYLPLTLNQPTTAVSLLYPANGTVLSSVNADFNFSTSAISGTCSLVIDGVSRNSTSVSSNGNYTLRAPQFWIDNNLDDQTVNTTGFPYNDIFSGHNVSVQCTQANSSVHKVSMNDPAYPYKIDWLPRVFRYSGVYQMTQNISAGASTAFVFDNIYHSPSRHNYDIDCMGYSVSNNSGMLYSNQVYNVTMRNCIDTDAQYFGPYAFYYEIYTNYGGPYYIYNNTLYGGYGYPNWFRGGVATVDNNTFLDGGCVGSNCFNNRIYNTVLPSFSNNIVRSGGPTGNSYVVNMRNNTFDNMSNLDARFDGNVTGNVFGGELYAVMYSSAAIFYNNYFNRTPLFIGAFNGASLNTTLTLGTNIVGGPYIGGNYYANATGGGYSQTCYPSNASKICSPLINANFTDYLPLTLNNPQVVELKSPGNESVVTSYSQTFAFSTQNINTGTCGVYVDDVLRNSSSVTGDGRYVVGVPQVALSDNSLHYWQVRCPLVNSSVQNFTMHIATWRTYDSFSGSQLNSGKWFVAPPNATVPVNVSYPFILFANDTNASGVLNVNGIPYNSQNYPVWNNWIGVVSNKTSFNDMSDYAGLRMRVRCDVSSSSYTNVGDACMFVVGDNDNYASYVGQNYVNMFYGAGIWGNSYDPDNANIGQSVGGVGTQLMYKNYTYAYLKNPLSAYYSWFVVNSRPDGKWSVGLYADDNGNVGDEYMSSITSVNMTALVRNAVIRAMVYHRQNSAVNIDIVQFFNAISGNVTYSNFNGSTTDFEDSVTGNFSYPVLEDTSRGKIVWNVPNVHLQNVDFNANVKMGDGWVSVNSSGLPVALNASANVSIYKAGLVNPRVLKDGVECTSCIAQTSGGLAWTFNVSGFSNYSLANGSYAEVLLWDNMSSNPINPNKWFLYGSGAVQYTGSSVWLYDAGSGFSFIETQRLFNESEVVTARISTGVVSTNWHFVAFGVPNQTSYPYSAWGEGGGVSLTVSSSGTTFVENATLFEGSVAAPGGDTGWYWVSFRRLPDFRIEVTVYSDNAGVIGAELLRRVTVGLYPGNFSMRTGIRGPSIATTNSIVVDDVYINGYLNATTPANNTLLTDAGAGFNFTALNLEGNTCELYIDNISQNSTVAYNGDYSLAAKQYLIDHNYDGYNHTWQIRCGVANTENRTFTVADVNYPLIVSSCRTLNQSGYYVLSQNVSGACIDIFANDVRFDCQGYSITGQLGINGNNVNVSNCVLGNPSLNQYTLYWSGGSNWIFRNNTFLGQNSYYGGAQTEWYDNSFTPVYSVPGVAMHGSGLVRYFDRNYVGYGGFVGTGPNLQTFMNMRNNTFSGGGFNLFDFAYVGNFSGNIVQGVYPRIRFVSLDANSNLYDNYFNLSMQIDSGASLASFNTTPQVQTNIIGLTAYGGNYWANSTGGFSESCYDYMRDGTCDSAYMVAASAYDYAPLTYLRACVGDGSNLTSPVANQSIRSNVTLTTSIAQFEVAGVLIDNVTMIAESNESSSVSVPVTSGDHTVSLASADVSGCGNYTVTDVPIRVSNLGTVISVTSSKSAYWSLNESVAGSFTMSSIDGYGNVTAVVELRNGSTLLEQKNISVAALSSAYAFTQLFNVSYRNVSVNVSVTDGLFTENGSLSGVVLDALEVPVIVAPLAGDTYAGGFNITWNQFTQNLSNVSYYFEYSLNNGASWLDGTSYVVSQSGLSAYFFPPVIISGLSVDTRVRVRTTDAYVTTSPGTSGKFAIIQSGNVTGASCAALTYPNESDLPAAAVIPVNFSIQSDVGFIDPVYNVSLKLGSTESSTGSCIVHNLSATNRMYECYVTMHYWYPAGDYALKIVYTDNGHTQTMIGGTCGYAELVSYVRNVGEIQFPAARPGVNNAPGDHAVQVFNTGNAPMKVYLVAYDLIGRTNPAATLSASAFKAGADLGSAVTLATGVQKYIGMTVPVGEGSTDDVLFWLSMPTGQMDQDYYTVNQWQIIGQAS